MKQADYKTPFLAFLLQWLAAHDLLKWMSDKMYIKLIYRFSMGEKLNLENPQTFNEKLQWLKLYDRNPLYTDLVDKYRVREFVKDRTGGGQHLIPLLGVWDKVEDIDFEKLPSQFVLKCNHDSGGWIICKDKKKLDISKARTFLKKRLARNFFWNAREWPYKNVRKKIIAEQYMVDESGTELKDYKFFCFNGKCKAIFIATDRGVDTRFDFFDESFNHLPFTNGHPNADKQIQRPATLSEMICIAELLSAGIPQVRVDLYDVFGHIYFGEMTFFHWGGKKPFKPKEWDWKFGQWIELPSKKSRSR
mgnify:CR=1 FL=1